MTACLCGLTLSLLSAMSADLGTTHQFTAQGYPERNPLARPFVQGRGGRGEVVLGLLSGGGYLLLAAAPPPMPRDLSRLLQTAAFTIHALLAIRNVSNGLASETPPIMLPILVVTFP